MYVDLGTRTGLVPNGWLIYVRAERRAGTRSALFRSSRSCGSRGSLRGTVAPTNSTERHSMEDTLWRRRLAVAASVLALGGFGAVAAGCGDDEGASEEIENNAAEDAANEGDTGRRK